MRSATVALCLLWTGCIYLDPVNRGPAGRIHPPAEAIRRGQTVTFTQTFADPEHRPGTFLWKVFACTRIEDAQAAGCDDSPVFLGTDQAATFAVPLVLSDGTPAQVLDVSLDARDDRGALAHNQEPFEILNGLPTLERHQFARAYTVGSPIDLFAKYADPDDPLGMLTVTWTVFSPNTQPPFTFAPIDDVVPDDLAHFTVGRRLVVQGTGQWTVRVTVTDPAGASVEDDFELTVVADRPACLAQWQPIAPPSGSALPITEPTVFQVPLVDDDLDVYPPLPGSAYLGTTAFRWSILRPGAAAREAMPGATGNSVDLDPSAFAPGQIVELRVEIFDRSHLVLPCAAELATCSLTSDPLCLQRQTWRVEIR